MNEQQTRTEEFEVSGEKLLATIKELIHQGNIRRIAIKSAPDSTLIEIPLILGVIGVVLAPQLALIGALATLVTRHTIVVERVEV